MMTTYITGSDAVYTGYGLGVRRNVYGGRTMWGHTGGVRGYGALMFYDPIGDISVAVLNNPRLSINGGEMRYELFEEIMPELIASLK